MDDLRQPMILEHHQVHAVGEVGLLRPRQLHLQHLVRDGRLALDDDTLRRLRRLLRRRLVVGACAESAASGTAATARRARSALGHYRPPFWPPAAGAGFVITTVRFSGTRYFFATRCTSAAVTLIARSARVLMSPGSL